MAGNRAFVLKIGIQYVSILPRFSILLFMSAKLENAIYSAIEELRHFPINDTQTLLEVNRAKALLSAIKGYFTEFGTTTEQDKLLRRIGFQDNNPDYSEDIWKDLNSQDL